MWIIISSYINLKVIIVASIIIIIVIIVIIIINIKCNLIIYYFYST